MARGHGLNAFTLVYENIDLKETFIFFLNKCLKTHHSEPVMAQCRTTQENPRDLGLRLQKEMCPQNVGKRTT